MTLVIQSAGKPTKILRALTSITSATTRGLRFAVAYVTRSGCEMLLAQLPPTVAISLATLRAGCRPGDVHQEQREREFATLRRMLRRLATALVIGTLFAGCVESSLRQRGGESDHRASPREANKKASRMVVTIAHSVLRGGPHGGQDIVEGVEMALDSFRGVLDDRYEVRYVIGDILHDRGVGWDAQREIEFARRMAADPTVIAYIAPNPSAATRVSLPIMNQAGIVMIGVSNTYPGFTTTIKGVAADPEEYYPSGRRTYVRVMPHALKHAEVAARWIGELGSRRVFILYDEDVAARAAAASVRDAIGTRAIEFMSIGPVRATQPSPDDIARRVTDAGADFVYCGCRNNHRVLEIVRAMVKNHAGAEIPLMGGGYMAAKAAAEFPAEATVYVTYAGLPFERFEGRAAEWLDAYKTRYGRSPRNQLGIFAYDAATIVMEALAAAPPVESSTALREELLRSVTGLRGWRSSLGLDCFDDRGDTASYVFSVARASPTGWITERVIRGPDEEFSDF